jgi:homoserine O-acetyltransferase
MHRKFGRRRLADEPGSSFGREFEVEDYLRAQGDKFVRRFDANTYLYLTRAMDSFDLVADHGSLQNAFAACTASFLVVSFRSDWLFPPAQSQAIVQALREAGTTSPQPRSDQDTTPSCCRATGSAICSRASDPIARGCGSDRARVD